MRQTQPFILALALVLLAGLSACSPAAPPAAEQRDSPGTDTGDGYRIMTVDEFAGILDAEPDAYTVVNVHIPFEGDVPNTDHSVAFNDVDALLAALPDRDAPIILYCRSGNMSAQASRSLVAAGYTNVYDVEGGMNAWTASGRTLIMQENE